MEIQREFTQTHTEAKPYQILGVRHLTDHCFSLKIERKGLKFKAGQCFNVGLGDGVNREYSSYAGENDPYLEFLIKEVEGGAVSPRLKKLSQGASVEIAGPYGLFTLLQENPLQNRYVFVGTGTGISPFRSFVRSYSGLSCKIIHGIRYEEEQYDFGEYPSDGYVSCVSRGEGGNFKGYVTNYLKSGHIERDAIYYLCGNRNMINDVFDLLTEEGISGDKIFTEVFF